MEVLPSRDCQAPPPTFVNKLPVFERCKDTWRDAKTALSSHTKKALEVPIQPPHCIMGEAGAQEGEKAQWRSHSGAVAKGALPPAQHCLLWTPLGCRAQVVCGCSLGKLGAKAFIYLPKYFLSVYVLGTGDMAGRTDKKCRPSWGRQPSWSCWR